MPYTAAPAAVQTSASRACRKWLWRESACLRLLLECTCRSKPPWATSQNRETSPVCSPKRLQKASRNWLYQRKLMPTGPFWRRRLLVQITSRSLHRHSAQVERSKLPTRGQLRNDIYSGKQLILYPRHGAAFAWTLFNLFGHVWKEGENRGYKHPCFCRGRVHFAFEAIG